MSAKLINILRPLVPRRCITTGRVSVLFPRNSRDEVLNGARATSCAHARCMSTLATPSDPPDSLLKPMNFPMKLLMGPGPSNCPPRVLSASALPMLGHLHPEFTQVSENLS